MRHDSTEVIPDCSNPVFDKKLFVPYNFEKPQTVIILNIFPLSEYIVKIRNL